MTTPAITDPAPAPAPVTTSAPSLVPDVAAPPASSSADPVAALVAELAALRADFIALKEAKPAPVVVPATDQGKPTITPVTTDPSSLPPLARMAAGYRK